MSQTRYTEKQIKDVWLEEATWLWDPKTHGSGAPLQVPASNDVQRQNFGQRLPSSKYLEFRLVQAGMSGHRVNSIVCEGVVVADDTDFAWITAPYEFFSTQPSPEDGSYDVYRINRSRGENVVYCDHHLPATATGKTMSKTRGQWPIQVFLALDDVPDMAKSRLREKTGPQYQP
jgi:hypothetical protein